MTNILPPPSTGAPAVQRNGDFTPVWRQWFIKLAEIINKSGGTGGSVPSTREIATTAPLAGGGDLSEDRTLTFEPDGSDGDVQINDAGALGSVTGITVTITTAKLTALGAEGSMVFTKGILTSQVQAT